jgi:large subunit ribosomal protein L3
MTRKLMGKKRGMLQLFDEKGNAIPCTIIEVEPNVVTQIKSKETDGYDAIQTGFEIITANDPRTIEKRTGKPLTGHFKKANTPPRRYLTEDRVDNVEDYTLGQTLDLSLYADQPYVDVTAISKGKGFQGVMKLHNFSGGPASHGSGFHRHAGSTGMRSTPGRCLPGGKRASHMGLDKKTVQNLKVIKVENNLLIVKGQVPGPRNGLVYINKAKKKHVKIA